MVAKNFNYAASDGTGELASLGTVRITDGMVEYFKARTEVWKYFGKMNSHLYRNKLFAKMDELKVTPTSRVLIFAMTSIIKSQPRIVEGMKAMAAEDKFESEEVWFETRNFLETHCCQYVTESKKTGKFPVVNLPNTLPGMDILWFCLTTDDASRTVAEIAIRPTFVQINLEADAQTRAKQGNETFWNTTIQGSKNPDKPEKPEFREAYYNTQASDKYMLYTLSGDKTIMTYPLFGSRKGYSLEDIERYLRSFDKKGKEPIASKSS